VGAATAAVVVAIAAGVAVAVRRKEKVIEPMVSTQAKKKMISLVLTKVIGIERRNR
jgi:hypothetical protein